MAATPCEDSILLTRANKKIADLKEDIRRLSDELLRKDSLLSSFMDVAHGQSKQLASLSAALQDTVAWDPATCPRPSSCSTPNNQSSWADVVACGRKRDSSGAASPPRLTLSNRYAALSDDSPVHPADAPAAPSDLDPTTAPVDTTAFPPLVADSAQVAGHSIVKPNKWPSTRSSTSASRRRILKEAVLRRSGALPRPEPAGNRSPRSDAPASPPHLPSRSHSTDRRLASHGNPLPSSPRPLFSPTTLIVGDSIIRNTRFFNAATHCFPGATVPVILDRLPGLLNSLPSSINRVLVHVGSNDTTRQQSELTKKDFNDLFSLLNNCGKSVYISGPLPTLARGAGRFSRVLGLNTWLQSACRAHHIGFIDNFNLFWNRSSLFRTDGVHPNWMGSRMLAANMQHAVQSATPE